MNAFLLKVFIPQFWSNYATALAGLFTCNYDVWTKYTNYVFPKIAKCDFLFIGPSGSIQYSDSLCLLSLNILNEKIFAVIWIWFVVLGLISLCNILHLIIFVPMKSYRILSLKARTTRGLSRSHICKATDNCCYGYWFILCQMSRNINKVELTDLMTAIHVDHYGDKRQN